MLSHLLLANKEKSPVLSRVSLVILGLALAAGVFVPKHAALAAGIQVSSRSDTLSDSRPSVTSNHTFSFKVNNPIYGSSVSNSSTVKLTFAPDFTIPSTLDCGDIDAATGTQFGFNYPVCNRTTTAWGVSVTNGISFVQANGNRTDGSQYNSTPFVDLPNTAGNLIVLAAVWDNPSATVLSVTDTVGNVYTSATGTVLDAAQIFYAKNIKGGANTVTVKLSAAASAFDVYIHEYSGAPIRSLRSTR